MTFKRHRVEYFSTIANKVQNFEEKVLLLKNSMNYKAIALIIDHKYKEAAEIYATFAK